MSYLMFTRAELPPTIVRVLVADGLPLPDVSGQVRGNVRASSHTVSDEVRSAYWAIRRALSQEERDGGTFVKTAQGRKYVSAVRPRRVAIISEDGTVKMLTADGASTPAVAQVAKPATVAPDASVTLSPADLAAVIQQAVADAVEAALPTRRKRTAAPTAE